MCSEPLLALLEAWPSDGGGTRFDGASFLQMALSSWEEADPWQWPGLPEVERPTPSPDHHHSDLIRQIDDVLRQALRCVPLHLQNALAAVLRWPYYRADHTLTDVWVSAVIIGSPWDRARLVDALRDIVVRETLFYYQGHEVDVETGDAHHTSSIMRWKIRRVTATKVILERQGACHDMRYTQQGHYLIFQDGSLGAPALEWRLESLGPLVLKRWRMAHAVETQRWLPLCAPLVPEVLRYLTTATLDEIQARGQKRPRE